MTTEPLPEFDEPAQTAIQELKGLITQQYPQATFEVAHGEDPEGVYLKTTVDIEDVDEVLDAVLDRLFAIQVERELPIYVIPLQPVERVLKELQPPRWPARPGLDWGSGKYGHRTAL
ncbi:MAG: hypothetical protein Q8R28_17580 [Dehalococcoidia bacterium]|nr:hypothetical protein [Dehalococcoidia bacterium]